jgi:polar amino acid transport system substrate-binding protein
VLLCWVSAGVLAQPKTLRLATTEWCPYTCVDSAASDNIIGRYISSVFDGLGIELEIESYPWSRAIVLAENGLVDGLLTAVTSEAPNLLFTSTPTSTYQVCFFVRDSEWRFNGTMKLKDEQLGIIQNYGYAPEIDAYIADPSNRSHLQVVSGQQGTVRLLRMLLSDRVDIIIEDRLVLAREAQKNNIDIRELKTAGCSQAQPFFLALTPARDFSAELIERLNIAFSEPDNLKRLKRLEAELVTP